MDLAGKPIPGHKSSAGGVYVSALTYCTTMTTCPSGLSVTVYQMVKPSDEGGDGKHLVADLLREMGRQAPELVLRASERWPCGRRSEGDTGATVLHRVGIGTLDAISRSRGGGCDRLYRHYRDGARLVSSAETGLLTCLTAGQMVLRQVAGRAYTPTGNRIRGGNTECFMPGEPINLQLWVKQARMSNLMEARRPGGRNRCLRKECQPQPSPATARQRRTPRALTPVPLI